MYGSSPAWVIMGRRGGNPGSYEGAEDGEMEAWRGDRFWI